MYRGEYRRVSGLRREEVAVLAGISIEYYTQFERGNATGVSESVIDGIAHAPQLDDAERAVLVSLRYAGACRSLTGRNPGQFPLSVGSGLTAAMRLVRRRPDTRRW